MRTTVANVFIVASIVAPAFAAPIATGPGVRPQDPTITDDPLAGVRPQDDQTFHILPVDASVQARSQEFAPGVRPLDATVIDDPLAGVRPITKRGVAPDTPIVPEDPNVTINYFGAPPTGTKREPGVAPVTPIIPDDPDVTINYFAKRTINGLPGAYGRPRPGAQPVESDDVLLALLKKRVLDAML